jgi:hypothetical protein
MDVVNSCLVVVPANVIEDRSPGIRMVSVIQNHFAAQSNMEDCRDRKDYTFEVHRALRSERMGAATVTKGIRTFVPTCNLIEAPSAMDPQSHWIRSRVQPCVHLGFEKMTVRGNLVDPPLCLL